MSQKIQLTPSGYQKLVKELAELKGPRRAALSEAIREARSHGDLRENAAYHEAKLNQARLEGRIADLEKVLEIAEIIERPDHCEDTAHLGSRVTLIDLEYREEMTITLVGNFEADPMNDLISIVSPLGYALLGKAEGDEIEVTAPKGIQRYQIIKVEYSLED